MELQDVVTLAQSKLLGALSPARNHRRHRE
jgi:hypothetical protein